MGAEVYYILGGRAGLKERGQVICTWSIPLIGEVPRNADVLNTRVAMATIVLLDNSERNLYPAVGSGLLSAVCEISR